MSKSGYNQFFETKRKLKDSGKDSSRSLQKRAPERTLRKKSSRKRKNPMPKAPIFWCVLLLGLCLATYKKEQQIVEFLGHLEWKMFSPVQAQEQAKPASAEPEKSSLDKFKEDQKKQANSKTWTEEEIALFTNLENRKREMDQREAELKQLEQELEKRKQDLETKLAELRGIRKGISDKLEERVQQDEEKVNKLVEVYSNMKPPQAAKVFAKIDESLAIQILARMKKQSAANILNLLEPDKAKRLSEKYVGYISMNK